MTNNTEQRCTESTESHLLRVNLGELLILVTLSDELTTGYTGLLTLAALLQLEQTELQRIERLQMFLQLCTAIGGTGEKQACNGPHVAQTKNLRDKTGDLVSDLKISSALKGNIYDFEIHKNKFSSNNSGLTVLEKDTTLIFRSWGFTGKLILTGRKFCLMVVVVSYRFYKKIMQCSYKKHVG